MQIVIYFSEKPVYLCDSLDATLKEILKHPDAIYLDEATTPAIHALLHEIKKPEFHAGVICTPDFEKLKKVFFKHFDLLEAAGGIVQNKEKEILFIFRKGKWDLPKGKIEKKETPETAALREIEEETGAKHLTLKKKIGETYHYYEAFGKKILKTTHWFYFVSSKPQNLKPQEEEDITEISWIPTRDIREPMQNTYASIKSILSDFFDTP